MKNSIKRAQSQARLSFAERENFRPKVKQLKKTLLTLVALLALTTGAMATTVTWVTNDFYNTSPVTFTKDDVTVTTTNEARMSNFFYGSGVNTFTTTLGIFTKIEIVFMPESSPLNIIGWDYEVIEAVEPDPEYMPGFLEYTSKLTWTGDAESVSIQGLVMNIQSITFTIGTPVPLTRGTGEKINEWTLTNGMPAGNVTVTAEYYPQAVLTAAPTAINDVPATTDGAIVKVGTVANIGSTETAQGTVMYYVSQTALDDDALLALDADQWKADVPTAESLAEGQAYVYYYARGNDSDTDEENFSDGDILAANALNVTIAAEPTYAVTFADGVNPEPPADPEWTASPNTDVKKGQTVTVTYTGTRKVIGVKAEKKASTPTLKDALKDGATVVITYTWMGGTNVTTFTYTKNGDEYTGSTTGDDAEYFANGMSKDGTTLKFTASNPDHSAANVSIDFDTDTNEYVASKGGYFTSFTISVNGTDVTSQLTKVK